MPLNLASSSSHGTKSTRGSLNRDIAVGPNVIDVDKVTSNVVVVVVNIDAHNTIILNRPDDMYFDSQNTWHLHIESAYKQSHAHKIALAFHQGSAPWIGKKCTVHFISVDSVGTKTTQKVVTISNFSDHYYEHIVAVDNVGGYKILQQNWTVV